MKMTLLAVLTLTAWVETAFSADTPAPQKTIGINPAYRNLSVQPGAVSSSVNAGTLLSCHNHYIDSHPNQVRIVKMT